MIRGDTGARSEEHLQREGDSQFRGGLFGGRAMVQGDTGARSEEHLQREGDSLLRGGPFGGYAMRRGDTGARSAIISSIITSKV